MSDISNVEFYKAALDSIPFPATVSNLEGKRLLANKAFAEFFKKSRESVVDLQLEAMYLPEDVDKIKKAFEQCLKEGYSRCEAVLIRGDNVPIPTNIYWRLFEVNGKKYITGMTADITEIKKAQEYTERLIQNIPVPFLVTDTNGKRKDINISAERFFGRKKEEVLGVKIEEGYAKSDINKIRKAVEECKKTGFASCEATRIRSDGTNIPVILNFSHIKDEKGNIVNILVTATDITELKKLESNLKSTIEQIVLVSKIVLKENNLSARIDVSKLTSEYKEIGENINKIIENAESNIEALQKMTNQLQALIQELSTPCIKIWDKIVIMPLIGSMTSDRMRDAQANLLKKIIDTDSRICIIDITGVPVMDTMVADGLMKTIKAVKIIGAEAVITGVSPEIASTLVSLDIAFDVVTKSKLSEGLQYAFSALNIKMS